MLLALSAPSLVAIVLAVVPISALAQGKPSGLPEGEGKDRVEAICTACHQAREIVRSSGYTREGWKELTSTMIDLSGAPEEQNRITQYLATHFPPNSKRAPKLIPGSAQIIFKEWQTPTLGQRSRDPIQGRDGTIWWAGQWGNVIGRINPATGEMKEYPLPANAMPHTVTLDAKGNVWYTGNKNATIGYLDPRTEKITEFKMPDPDSKDPHSAIFDAKGVLWFTMQLSNRVGRLDPATGDIKIVEMTMPKSRPYGIKIAPDGTPWFACNGRPCIVRIDPQTMELTVVKVPGEKGRVRRLDIDRDGSAATAPRRERSRSGLHPADRSLTPMRSSSSTASSGTTSRGRGRMRWFDSTRRPRRSKAGRSPRGASTPASSGTCAPRRTGTSSSTRAAPTASSS